MTRPPRLPHGIPSIKVNASFSILVRMVMNASFSKSGSEWRQPAPFSASHSDPNSNPCLIRSRPMSLCPAKIYIIAVDSSR